MSKHRWGRLQWLGLDLLNVHVLLIQVGVHRPGDKLLGCHVVITHIVNVKPFRTACDRSRRRHSLAPRHCSRGGERGGRSSDGARSAKRSSECQEVRKHGRFRVTAIGSHHLPLGVLPARIKPCFASVLEPAVARMEPAEPHSGGFVLKDNEGPPPTCPDRAVELELFERAALAAERREFIHVHRQLQPFDDNLVAPERSELLILLQRFTAHCEN